MKRVINIILLILIFVICVTISRTLNHKLRTVAQKDKQLYRLMLDLDSVDFILGGSGFGYSNYHKFQYAKMRKNKNYPKWKRFILWDRGILYDVSNPPESYQYPYLGTDPFKV